MRASKIFRNLAVARRENTLVLVHSKKAPSAQEWQAYLDEITSVPDPSQLGVLVLSYGGSPNADQRKMLQDCLSSIGAGNARYAIVLDGLLPRMALRALSVFIKGMKGFRPDEIDDALRHLRVGAGKLTHIHADLRELCGVIGVRVPESLRGTGSSSNSYGSSNERLSR